MKRVYEEGKEVKEFLIKQRKNLIKEMRKMFCKCNKRKINFILAQSIIKELEEIEEEISKVDNHINSLKEELGI